MRNTGCVVERSRECAAQLLSLLARREVPPVRTRPKWRVRAGVQPVDQKAGLPSVSGSEL